MPPQEKVCSIPRCPTDSPTGAPTRVGPPSTLAATGHSKSTVKCDHPGPCIGRGETRVCAGHLHPGSTKWGMLHRRLQMVVDTSHCNFTNTPVYLVSVLGKAKFAVQQQWHTVQEVTLHGLAQDSFLVR